MVTQSKAKSDPSTLLTNKENIVVEALTIQEALSRPNWVVAMKEELATLEQNQTWDLVLRVPGMNVIGSRWVFKTKLNSDGSIDKFKGRLVAKGYKQKEDIDFEETSALSLNPLPFESFLPLPFKIGLFVNLT